MTVESVAWVAELKNALSLAFLLGAMIAYLDYDAGNRGEIAAAAKPAADAGLSYALALMLFVLASLSKSSVVMFPFVVLLHAWWKRGRLQRRDRWDRFPFSPSP